MIAVWIDVFDAIAEDEVIGCVLRGRERTFNRNPGKTNAVMASEMIERDLWRHKKTGGLYRFLTLAILERDRDTIMAVYESYDAEHADAEAQERWVRPAIEFYERFEQHAQGEQP